MSTSSEVLGPYNTGGIKRPRRDSENQEESDQLQSLIEEQAQKKEKKSKKEKKEKKSSKEKKKSKSKNNNNAEENEVEEPEELEEAELTLEERLAILSSQMDDLENDRLQSEDDQIDNNKQKSQAATDLSIPTADSLVTLLEQALQSGDTYLLEQCLACSNLEIIDATIRKLPTQRVLVLLKTLVAKFERRPSRGILITHWISCILKHHLSYLISVPDLSHQLAGLSQILEQRISSYSRLTTLAGRLDLLMSQVVKQQQISSFEPKTIYEF